MPLYLRDKRIDELVSQLSKKRGKSKTEIVRNALELEAANDRPKKEELFAAIRALQEKVKQSAGPNAGHKMTKEEIDWLYE